MNLRIPKGKPVATIKQELVARLGKWTSTSHVPVAFDYSLDEPMFRNPEGEWVKALLAVASEKPGHET